MSDKQIKMERNGQTSDIHPNSVETMEALGWKKVKTAKADEGTGGDKPPRKKTKAKKADEGAGGAE